MRAWHLDPLLLESVSLEDSTVKATGSERLKIKKSWTPGPTRKVSHRVPLTILTPIQPLTTKPFTALRKRGSWTFLAQAAYRLYMGFHVFGSNLSTKMAHMNGRAVFYKSYQYHGLQHFAASSSLTSCEASRLLTFLQIFWTERHIKKTLATKQGRQAGATATCCILPLPASRLCSVTPRTWLGSDPVGNQLATKLPPPGFFLQKRGKMDLITNTIWCVAKHGAIIPSIKKPPFPPKSLEWASQPEKKRKSFTRYDITTRIHP